MPPRTCAWRGIFAVFTLDVVKEHGAPPLSPAMIYTAWGEPIRIDGFAADGRWFRPPSPRPVVKPVDGDAAEPLIRKFVRWRELPDFVPYGDYSPWPGPEFQ